MKIFLEGLNIKFDTKDNVKQIVCCNSLPSVFLLSLALGLKSLILYVFFLIFLLPLYSPYFYLVHNFCLFLNHPQFLNLRYPIIFQKNIPLSFLKQSNFFLFLNYLELTQLIVCDFLLVFLVFFF